jgi:hypothetical protein
LRQISARTFAETSVMTATGSLHPFTSIARPVEFARFGNPRATAHRVQRLFRPAACGRKKQLMDSSESSPGEGATGTYNVADTNFPIGAEAVFSPDHGILLVDSDDQR